MPEDLIIESADMEAVTKAAELRTQRRIARQSGTGPAHCDDVDQANEDAEAEAADAAAELAKHSPAPSGFPCVSLRLKNNHLLRLDALPFENLPHLRALDLATNHIESLSLGAPGLSRLSYLSLRNNRLSELCALAPLGRSLRRLDVSLNRLSSLAGVGALRMLHVLAACGNQLRGGLPAELRALRWLVTLDLSHNELDGVSADALLAGGPSLGGPSAVGPSVGGRRSSLGGASAGGPLLGGLDALGALESLCTLRLSHNSLGGRVLPALARALGGLRLVRLELYANPLASEASYPEALLRVQPALLELDHLRLPASRLSAGGTSRRSIAEAIDSIAASASGQHASLVERQRDQHRHLLARLASLREAAEAAFEEYELITAKALAVHDAAITDAKRAHASYGAEGGALAATDAALAVRQALLSSERVSQQRYREAIGAVADGARAALEEHAAGNASINFAPKDDAIAT